jgi:hypothetical protein
MVSHFTAPSSEAYISSIASLRCWFTRFLDPTLALLSSQALEPKKLKICSSSNIEEDARHTLSVFYCFQSWLSLDGGVETIKFELGLVIWRLWPNWLVETQIILQIWQPTLAHNESIKYRHSTAWIALALLTRCLIVMLFAHDSHQKLGCWEMISAS